MLAHYGAYPAMHWTVVQGAIMCVRQACYALTIQNLRGTTVAVPPDLARAPRAVVAGLMAGICSGCRSSALCATAHQVPACAQTLPLVIGCLSLISVPSLSRVSCDVCVLVQWGAGKCCGAGFLSVCTSRGSAKMRGSGPPHVTNIQMSCTVML